MEYNIEEVIQVMKEVERTTLEDVYYNLTHFFDYYIELLAYWCHHTDDDNWKKWVKDVVVPYIETKYKNSQIEKRLKEMGKDF